MNLGNQKAEAIAIAAPRKTWGFSQAGIALIPRNVYNT